MWVRGSKVTDVQNEQVKVQIHSTGTITNNKYYCTTDLGAFAKLGLCEVLNVLICLTIVTVSLYV